jgi:hypothetical protein
MLLASSGAAVLVAEMARSGWAAAREAAARFFGLGGESAAEEEMRLVDAGRQRLVQSPEVERETVAGQVQRELESQLAVFLRKHPEAAKELQELVDGAPGKRPGSGAQLTATNNQNSQVIISGDSIIAGGGFHYNSSPEGKK